MNPITRPTPRRAAELDRAWLTATLRAADAPVLAGPIVSVDTTVFGADRGFTGEVARVVLTSAGGELRTLVAKFPDTTTNFERCAREVRFLEAFGNGFPMQIPRLRAGVVDEEAAAVVLLLDEVRGEDGDCVRGCSAAQAAAVVQELAAMHARWWNEVKLRDIPWLPRWGQGEAAAADPHRRRAQRYRKRLVAFRSFYEVPPAFDARLDRIAGDAEGILAAAARITPTLIHADVHEDNIIRPPAGPPVLLDWQSVSFGPGLYDVIRYVVESARGIAVADQFAETIASYRDHLRQGGVPESDLRDVDADVRTLLGCIVIGFVCGYGGRDPATMGVRERLLPTLTLAPDRLAGVAVSHLDG